jgi:uncharacterized lipoprotein YmbA
MKLTLRLCIVSLAAVLAACASSPPVQFYSLEPTADPVKSSEPSSMVVGVGPIRVPEYLKRSQMVTRGPGAEVEVHEFHRWAEPVGKAIHRVVAADVDSQLKDVVAIAYPFLEPVQVNYVVLGQVDRFDADSSGQVVLQVQWAVQKLHGPDEEGLIAPQRSRYTAQAASPENFNDIAKAMNRALDEFGGDIAAQLRKALSKNQPSEQD